MKSNHLGQRCMRDIVYVVIKQNVMFLMISTGALIKPIEVQRQHETIVNTEIKIYSLLNNGYME